MHTLTVDKCYKTVVKIQPNITIKRVSRLEHLSRSCLQFGLKLYQIKETGRLFTSEEVDPLKAFHRFANKTSRLTLHQSSVHRIRRHPAPNNDYIYCYQARGSSQGNFHSEERNIYLAFLSFLTNRSGDCTCIES